MSDSDEDSDDRRRRNRRGGGGGVGGRRGGGGRGRRARNEDDDDDDDDNDDNNNDNDENLEVLQDPGEDTLRIMLSTDNHLGFAESDPIRGMDSFAAFEEVLYLARRFHCDMVLLSGDLFHENRPSRQTLYKTMEIVRRYCMGPNPVQIQVLSDPSLAGMMMNGKTSGGKGKKQQRGTGNNGTTTAAGVNYQDANYSVDLPIFSIHGNHDDPTRDGGGGGTSGSGGDLLAALDLLSISNLVNYFGRQNAVDKLEIGPLLLRKGSTKVALYGLGSMRDERLNRMFQSKKVRFLRPWDENEDDEDDDDDNHDDNDDDEDKEGFFNLFTLHQNRDSGRGSKNCVQESMIPHWMDLVVWGHEHECLVEFFESVVGTFRITQPGSSVATSLVAGEAVRKRVGVLDIHQKQFRLFPIPLTQVRPFVTADIALNEHTLSSGGDGGGGKRGRGGGRRTNEALDPDDPKVDEKISALLEEQVKVLILNAREKQEELLRDAAKLGNDAAAAAAAGGGDDDNDSPLEYGLEKPDQVLVRVRVDHSGFSTLNNQRFGAKFVGQIANPTDTLLFYRAKKTGVARKTAAAGASNKAFAPLAPEELDADDNDNNADTHIRLLREFLQGPESQLKVLDEPQLTEALDDFATKSLNSSIVDCAQGMLKSKQDKLIRRTAAAKGGDGEEINKAGQVRDLVEQESQKQQEKKRKDEDDNGKDDMDEDDDDDEKETNGKKKKNKKAKSSQLDLSDDDDDDEDPPPAKKTSSTRGRKIAAADAKRKTAASGRRRKLADLEEEDEENHHDDDDDDEEIIRAGKKQQQQSRGTAGGRASRARKKVNYSMDDDGDDNDDDDEVSDAIVNDDSDDDADSVQVVEAPPKKKRGAATPARRGGRAAVAAKSRGTPARGRAGTRSTPLRTATKKAAAATTKGRGGAGRRKRRLEEEEDSDDDVVYAGSTADFGNNKNDNDDDDGW